MKFTEAIDNLPSNPRKLFLIDGLGALLSAFLLGVVLVELESIFGIPRPALYLLAAIPCFFALYDLYSYMRVRKDTPLFLRMIAIANIAYCILSISLAIYHHQSLTYLGWIYIIGEVGIVLSLAVLELSIAGRMERKI